MTYSFSYDHYFSNFNSGFGLLAYKDAAGTGQLGTFSVGVQYSYNFKIFETYLYHGRACTSLTGNTDWPGISWILLMR